MACTLSTLEIIHYITLHNIAKFNHFGASYSDWQSSNEICAIFHVSLESSSEKFKDAANKMLQPNKYYI